MMFLYFLVPYQKLLGPNTIENIICNIMDNVKFLKGIYVINIKRVNFKLCTISDFMFKIYHIF